MCRTESILNFRQEINTCRRVVLEKLTVAQPVEKFFRILWKLKVHCRNHKSQPPVSQSSASSIQSTPLNRWKMVKFCGKVLLLEVKVDLEHSLFFP